MGVGIYIYAFIPPLPPLMQEESSVCTSGLGLVVFCSLFFGFFPSVPPFAHGDASALEMRSLQSPKPGTNPWLDTHEVQRLRSGNRLSREIRWGAALLLAEEARGREEGGQEKQRRNPPSPKKNSRAGHGCVVAEAAEETWWYFAAFSYHFLFGAAGKTISEVLPPTPPHPNGGSSFCDILHL